MNLPSQLTRLILSFYRENPSQLLQLHCLCTCKLSRRWGVLRIECQNQQTVNVLTDAIAILQEPIAQLRLAHQINILLRGSVVLSLPVSPSRLTMW